MFGTILEENGMGQAITDYGKFLAEAREAVDSLNCDQNTYDQLAAEEIRLERELEAAKKAVADNISPVSYTHLKPRLPLLPEALWSE